MKKKLHLPHLMNLSLASLILVFATGCEKNLKDMDIPQKSAIEGTWKMVYAEIRERDSVQVKDLSATDFIKIINRSHFAFFNQDRGTAENFMSGAGTYTFNESDYVETLDFIGIPELRNHEFPFTVEFRGDTLIQQGHEKVEEAGIDRYILEKYIRIKN